MAAADAGQGEMKKLARRPDTISMWSGELNADVAASEAYALSPGTVEDMFARPSDVAAAYEEDAAADNKQNPKKGLAEKLKEKFSGQEHQKKEQQGEQSTKVGCIDKVKDLISGPKPRGGGGGELVESPVGYVHGGPVPVQRMAAPAMTGRPVGTHDVHRKENIKLVDKLVPRPATEGAVHGGLGAEKPKKEGVMSKVIDKLHLGSNKT